MSFATNSMIEANSGQEEYFYHLQEAQDHLKNADKAMSEVNWHMKRFEYHMQECNKNFK